MTASANFALGLLILAKGRKGWASFFLGITALLLALWVLIYMVVFPLTGNQLWGKLSNGLGAANVWVAALFIYFLTKERVVSRWGKFLIFLSGLGASGLVLLSPTDFIVRRQITTIYHVEHGPGYPLLLGYILLLLGFAIGRLFYAYRQAGGLLRLQIQYLLLAATTTPLLILITMTFLPALGFFQLKSVSPLFTVFFFSFTSYGILRYRLLDIRLAIQKGVVFLALALASPLVYLSIIQALERTVLKGFGGLAPLAAALTLTIIVLGGIELTRIFQTVTEGIFFRGSYLYAETLDKMTRILSRAYSMEDLCKKLTREIASTFQTDRVIFLLKDEKKKAFVPAHVAGLADHLVFSFKLSDALIRYAQRKDDLFLVEELKEEKSSLAEKTLKKLQDRGIALCLPIRIRESLEGLVCLGEKLSDNPYTSRDISLLQVVSNQAGVALENARLYSSLEEKVKERTEALERAQEKEVKRLEEIAHLKDEFAFIASHELRAPTTAIKWFLEEVLNNPKVFESLPDETKRNLLNVGRASENLRNLIDDLLDVSRIESGKINIREEPVNLKKAFLEIEEELSPQAKEKRIEIKSVIPDDISVFADPDKLKEIFTNLFSNAIKFTKQDGKIEVTAKKQGKQVITSVSDTGIGLSKEELSHLFEKFWRSREATGIEGTGLGLWITKKLVEKMDGRIWAESKKDKGSTFSFSLPTAEK